MPNCPLGCGRRLATAAALQLHLAEHEEAAVACGPRQSASSSRATGAPTPYQLHRHPPAALRPAPRQDSTASPSRSHDTRREQRPSTRTKVLETSVSTPSTVIRDVERLGVDLVEYPTPLDVTSVLSWLPTGKVRFDYPRTPVDWVAHCWSLRTLCSPLFLATCGAKALDDLHYLLFSSLASATCVARPPPHQKTYKRVADMRDVLRGLRKKMKHCSGDERGAVKKSIYATLALQKELKGQLKKEIKAQEFRANLKMLRRNPTKVAQKIWGGNLSSAPPEVDVAVAEAFFSKTFSAPSTAPLFPMPDWLPPSRAPDLSNPPTFSVKDVRKILRRTKNRSAPGLDGVPYSMLKALPWLHHLLAHLFSLVAAQSQVPVCWRQSITVLLHKRGPLDDLSNFRPISLTPTCSMPLLRRKLRSSFWPRRFWTPRFKRGF